MLKIIQVIISIPALIILTYMFITKDFTLQPLAILLLGTTMLIVGIDQFQQGNKKNAWLCVIVGLVNILVLIQMYL